MRGSAQHMARTARSLSSSSGTMRRDATQQSRYNIVLMLPVVAAACPWPGQRQACFLLPAARQA